MCIHTQRYMKTCRYIHSNKTRQKKKEFQQATSNYNKQKVYNKKKTQFFCNLI